MAFRIEARIAFVLAATVTFGCAQPFEYSVVHRHTGRDRPAVLRFEQERLVFSEAAKDGHSRAWKYSDIQQLTLGTSQVRVLTYDDGKWALRRDREYVFSQLPKDAANEVYAFLSQRLDQRFIAALAPEAILPIWEGGAKLASALGGSEGVLIIGADSVIYRTMEGKSSRTWRMADIENVSHAGSLDLTIATNEKRGFLHGAPIEFRFQLKRELPDEIYNRLWRQSQNKRSSNIMTSHTGEK